MTEHEKTLKKLRDARHQARVAIHLADRILVTQKVTRSGERIDVPVDMRPSALWQMPDAVHTDSWGRNGMTLSFELEAPDDYARCTLGIRHDPAEKGLIDSSSYEATSVIVSGARDSAGARAWVDAHVDELCSRAVVWP